MFPPEIVTDINLIVSVYNKHTCVHVRVYMPWAHAHTHVHRCAEVKREREREKVKHMRMEVTAAVWTTLYAY